MNNHEAHFYLEELQRMMTQHRGIFSEEFVCANGMAILALEQARKESRWIPCSERLPDDFGDYLVTKKAIGWNCEEYNSNDIAYFDNKGFHKAEDVIAWMPLPNPYEGVGKR